MYRGEGALFRKRRAVRLPGMLLRSGTCSVLAQSLNAASPSGGGSIIVNRSASVMAGGTSLSNGRSRGRGDEINLEQSIVCQRRNSGSRDIDLCQIDAHLKDT